jgi:hypothetical protein
MKILVERFDSGSEDTFGRLYIDGKLQCMTLEDEFREVKKKGDTRIPAGTYKVGKRYSPSKSPKTGHDMLWIKDVPGFQYILIHTGNTEDDTEGCLIVGTKIGKLNGKRAVLDSKLAYNKIYPIVSAAIDRGEDVEIKYMDNVK